MEQKRGLLVQKMQSGFGRDIWNARTLYALAYLIATITANLAVAWLGSWVTPITAFVSIGLSITARDYLHEEWDKRGGLAWRMTLLIGIGSLLSWLLNRDAGRIAIASFIAFATSGLVDTLIYHATRKWSQFERVNWSNLGSAMVDSILFPALAFGWPPDMAIIYGQATAKIGGGLFWSLVLVRLNQ